MPIVLAVLLISALVAVAFLQWRRTRLQKHILRILRDNPVRRLPARDPHDPVISRYRAS